MDDTKVAETPKTLVEQALAEKVKAVQALADSEVKLKSLVIGTPAYDSAAATYLVARRLVSSMQAKLLSALQADNRVKIGQVEDVFVKTLVELAKRSNIESLLGEPVARITYFAASPETAAGGDAKPASLTFNGKVQVLKPAMRGSQPMTGRPVYSKGAESHNATSLVQKYGTDAERAVKYPHKAADKVAAREGFSKAVAERAGA